MSTCEGKEENEQQFSFNVIGDNIVVEYNKYSLQLTIGDLIKKHLICNALRNTDKLINYIKKYKFTYYKLTKNTLNLIWKIGKSSLQENKIKVILKVN